MKIAVTAVAFGLAGFSVAAGSAHAQQITGAGATFPAPVYTKWGELAKAASGIELNYQAIGSGGGQNQILQRTVDFGASDAPMDPAKLESGKLLQFPTVMGSVVVIVNIPGVETNQLKLTGELLADIYEGKITKWNDPKLVEANQRSDPAERGDRAGVSCGWVGDDFRLHILPVSRQPKLEGQGRRQHQREVAGGCGRQGQ